MDTAELNKEARAQWAVNQYYALPVATKKALLPVVKATTQKARQAAYAEFVRARPNLTQWENGGLVDVLDGLFRYAKPAQLEAIKCQQFM